MRQEADEDEFEAARSRRIGRLTGKCADNALDGPRTRRAPARQAIWESMMGCRSIWHWLIVLVIVLVLFGRGRISEIMGDFGKGIKSFKQGMNEDDKTPSSRRPHSCRSNPPKSPPRASARNPATSRPDRPQRRP